ncbi:MAG: hypothetical protein WC900_01540 [Oscillospiraceae bacterium]
MNPIIKGVTLGVTVGAIAYAMSNTSSKSRRRMKRTAGKAMKAVGSVVDGISFMMR